MHTIYIESIKTKITYTEHPLPDPDMESYHDEIGKEEAVARLEKWSRHHNLIRCYLTRYSQQQECFILSVCELVPERDTFIAKIKDFKIHFEPPNSPTKFWIHTTKKFNSKEELLKNYEKNRISPAFINIGKCLVLKEYRKWLTKQISEKEDSTRRENTRTHHRCTLI